MKQWLPLLLTILCAAAAPLAAETATDLYGAGSESSEPLTTPETSEQPYSVFVDADFIGSSHFCDSKFDHDTISFWIAQANAGWIVFHNPAYEEGVSLSLTYWRDNINWKENPYFDQRYFNTLTINTGFFSSRLCDWLWRTQLGLNVDANESNLCEYTTFDLMLWGRYTYNECAGFHVGFIAQTGQRIDHVYPIIGIDWTITDKWKLNAVFPTQMSVIYTVSPKLSLALGGRFFDVRHRVGKDERLKQALVEYRSGGLEVGVNYNPAKRFNLNLHAGSTLMGHLKISNKHHHRKQRLKFGGAPYVGCEADMHF